MDGTAPCTARQVLPHPCILCFAIEERCLRCHQCLRSCPNRIIRSASLETGLAGLFTPHLVFGPYGYDYQCQVCQLVCPNEAIPRQTLARKQATPIGKTRIAPDACVVTAKGVPCLVCEEFCPIPEKAVRFEVRVVEAGGVRQVVETRCNGCGICQANCPAEPLAIRVKKG